MKIIVIGAVASTKIIIEELIEAGNPPEFVFSLDESLSSTTSGYVPLHELARKKGIPSKQYRKINDRENVEIIKAIGPDYIFAVGFSQLVGQDILVVPKYGVIGVHPAPLPKFRGRAAIVWQMLLKVHSSKVSMFLMDEGIDSGPILGQEPFVIKDDDYISDVIVRTDAALITLAKRVIPQLLSGTLDPIMQNEDDATYLLMRTPEDGKIKWDQSAKDIELLIRSVSKPYPGAYALYENKSVVFWKAKAVKNDIYIGLPGQIAYKDSERIGVVCKDGILEVFEYNCDDDCKFRIGHKFK